MPDLDQMPEDSAVAEPEDGSAPALEADAATDEAVPDPGGS